MAVVAQRNTAWPSWYMKEFRSGIAILGARSPALPQATGPMPGGSPSATGPTTAAPTPSAKMMQVDRSSGSIQPVIFSDPMTSAYLEETARIELDRLSRAHEK